MAIAINRTIAALPHLASLLAGHPRAVAGWGRKPSGRHARLLARALGRPFVLLEDGFLRSVERQAPPLSLLVDDLGVYYDAAAPSRMEATIAAPLSPAQTLRARALVATWQASGLSKYNHAADHAGPLPARYVLVADQCHGDLSVTYGQAGAASFATMLRAALADYPDHQLLVKTHPDVLTHRRRGWFDPAALAHPRIRLIGDGSHPVRLIQHASAVYTVTSLIGFEALLHGRPLRCFGLPFYAGWGLSEDWLPAPQRRGSAPLEALVHAALVALARYVDPASGQLWSAEAALAHATRARTALLHAQGLTGQASTAPAPPTLPAPCTAPAPAVAPPPILPPLTAQRAAA